MPLDLRHGNVLDAMCLAVVLTIDGAAPGMEGNIARAFAKRWPDAWEEIEEQLDYPVVLGDAVILEVEAECPFRYVAVVSTLHHAEVFSDQQKKAVVRTAMENVLALCRQKGIASVATAIMTGSWRLPQSAALISMIEGFEASEAAGEIPITEIWVYNDREFANAHGIARSLGFLR